MTKQEQFFFDNAGFSFDPKAETEAQGKARCARAMAQAETYAVQQGWEFEISPDPDADESFMDNDSDEYKARWKGTAWQCILWSDLDHTELLGSLGGCFGDSKYKRVVKAEVALEAMPALCTCGHPEDEHILTQGAPPNLLGECGHVDPACDCKRFYEAR